MLVYSSNMLKNRPKGHLVKINTPLTHIHFNFQPYILIIIWFDYSTHKVTSLSLHLCDEIPPTSSFSGNSRAEKWKCMFKINKNTKGYPHALTSDIKSRGPKLWGSYLNSVSTQFKSPFDVSMESRSSLE